MRPLAILTAATFVFAAQAAAANCSDGISEVRSAMKNATVSETQKERVEGLLDQAAEQREAGNEQQCEQLVSSAKQTLGITGSMGKPRG